MSSIFTSVTINDCHMLRDLGLALSRTDCVQPPVPKTTLLDIPGGNGAIDITDSMTGRTVYNNREIKMEFGRGLGKKEWPTLYSDLLRRFHGQKVKVIFDDDKNYYYAGRATVSEYSRFQMLGTVVITVDAEPYKLEMLSSLDNWLWDTFNFKTGIIRSYKNLVVDGERTLRVVGRSKVVVPLIISDAAMTVSFNGGIYDVVAGNNKIYDIVIEEGENSLTFAGHGIVSVDYRGGLL